MALKSRPPVITIMGHVDHGKTTLLDYIRKTRVQAGEAGGITQHIGAYQAEYKGKPLTFIDTPGHAAFNKMRERGAQITDIVILVVAANDGVKPQTIESIRYIKQSKAHVIVAVNKVDLPDVYPDMAKGQLAEHGIVVQSLGGDVDAIEISAKTGQGVDNLLETITVTAELLDLKADPVAPLEAVVIESSKDSKKGPVASVVVQQGTLKIRQNLIVNGVDGRVRGLVNESGQQLKEVLPGGPAEIIGLKDVPAVGEIILDADADYEMSHSVESDSTSQDEQAEDITDDDPFAGVDFDFGALVEDKPKLKLIIKADVEGTLEAIMQNLDDESVELIDYGTGDVTEGDVEYANTSGAKILAFHVKANRRVKDIAKTQGVKIKEYEIIYQLIEDLQKQMLKLIEPTIDEVVTGEAEILQIFDMKGERIAGCRVKTGEIKKSDLLHLKRGDEIVANPVIKSMMHGKEEINQVKAKNECGFTFKNKKLDFQVGDTVIAYRVEED